MILAFLLACAHDPPMRPMGELPYIAERGLAFSTEEQAFFEVRRALEMAGFSGLSTTQLSFSEQVLLPASMGSTLHTRRALSDPLHARQHLSEVGLAFLGRPFALEGWSDADLWEAYQAFFVVSLGHELSHVAAASGKAHDFMDVYAEERRARQIEWPLLQRLVAQNRAPERWLALYPRFLETLLSEIPAEAVALVPTDPHDSEQARALFRSGFLATLNSPDPTNLEMQAALAMAYQMSLEFTKNADTSLEMLVQDYAPHPADTELLVAGGVQLLQSEGFSASPGGGGLTLKRDGLPYGFSVQFDEDGDLARVWARHPIAVEPARQAELIRALNIANRDGSGALVLETDGLALRSDWFSLRAEHELAVAVRFSAAQADAWFPALERVARGESSAEQALESARLALTPTEVDP